MEGVMGGNGGVWMNELNHTNNNFSFLKIRDTNAYKNRKRQSEWESTFISLILVIISGLFNKLYYKAIRWRLHNANRKRLKKKWKEDIGKNELTIPESSPSTCKNDQELYGKKHSAMKYAVTHLQVIPPPPPWKTKKQIK